MAGSPPCHGRADQGTGDEAGGSTGDRAALEQARRLLALADGLTLRVLVRDLEPAEALAMLEAEVDQV